MAEGGVWPSLSRAVEVITQQSAEAVELRINHENLQTSRLSLRNELKAKREQYLQDLQVAESKIKLLKDQKKNDQLHANARLMYIEKWLNAQAEVLELQFYTPQERIPSTDHENRIHDELNRAYHLQVKEREKLIEFWRLKYADDTARMNEMLAQKRDELQIAIAKHEELQQLYNLHQGEMRAWLTFKRERAARLAREARARDSATRIQAWWRGLMVRKGLGAFKHLRNAKKSSGKPKKK